MKPARTPPVLVALFMILISVSHGDAVAEVNHWNGLASAGFTQGFVRTDCPGQTPCQSDAFDEHDIAVHCPFGIPQLPFTCTVQTTGIIGWRLNGLAGHLPGPGGDAVVATIAFLSGERIDADLFVVDGQVSGSGASMGIVEVAVFRYSGDPTVFIGLEAESIQDVVDLGIISSDDVLAVDTFVRDDPIDMQVQVTGLSDDEIVVFAAGDGRIPPLVPATNTVGAVLLLLAMLAAGTGVILIRRRVS